MDEAEPDMKETKSRTMDIVQEKGEPGEAGRSCKINPHPPLCPFWVVEEWTCSPNRKGLHTGLYFRKLP
jgi:hypothetical protein